ncbi:MAG: YdiU family protein [Polyangiaceae bacterium]
MDRALFPFENTYAKLPERFYARVPPSPVRAPSLLRVNERLAHELGLDAEALATEEGVSVLAGNRVPPGADPVALAYAGHQFGSFVPQLGDGRALLLGEVVDKSGAQRDLQLKGSGPTPFSRRGDGRAALGPVLREYLVSDAMAALGLPTTRALAAVATGEPVFREEPLPGAVLTRVGASHIRVGTFQYFAVRRDREALSILTRYALERHYPGRVGAAASERDRALALLDAVAESQASLVAGWMGVGFIHGVMNTDNSAISGETLDYGPCAFLDDYHPDKAFSSIDHAGRYAFGNQLRIAGWNLARLAEALLSLVDDEPQRAATIASERVERFAELGARAESTVFSKKLGLETARETDHELIDDLLERMAAEHVDFTLFFRRLADAAEDPNANDRVSYLFQNRASFFAWEAAWRRRIAEEPHSARGAAMRRVNPAFIPRNHQVEAALAAARSGDFTPFDRLHAALARPYDEQPQFADLGDPPAPHERVRATFCGT